MSEDKKTPQRVSISYSVDLAEVPHQVKLLMGDLANSFEEAAQVCRHIGEQCITDPVDGMHQISQVKDFIERASFKADDLTHIMMAYLDVLQEVYAARAEPEPQEEPEETKPA